MTNQFLFCVQSKSARASIPRCFPWYEVKEMRTYFCLICLGDFDEVIQIGLFLSVVTVFVSLVLISSSVRMILSAILATLRLVAIALHLCKSPQSGSVVTTGRRLVSLPHQSSFPLLKFLETISVSLYLLTHRSYFYLNSLSSVHLHIIIRLAYLPRLGEVIRYAIVKEVGLL